MAKNRHLWTKITIFGHFWAKKGVKKSDFLENPKNRLKPCITWFWDVLSIGITFLPIFTLFLVQKILIFIIILNYEIDFSRNTTFGINLRYDRLSKSRIWYRFHRLILSQESIPRLKNRTFKQKMQLFMLNFMVWESMKTM